MLSRSKGRWLTGFLLVSAMFSGAVGCQKFGFVKDKTQAELPPPMLNGSDRGSKLELSSDKTAKLYLETAQLMESRGQPDQAVVFYERARQADPKCADLNWKLAVLYDNLGAFPRAKEEYRGALEKHPNNADLLNDIGYSYFSRERWEEAEAYFRKALGVNPKHSNATIHLAMALAHQNRYQDSLAVFHRVLTPAQAQANLGFVLLAQGRKEQARNAYHRALSMDPDLERARAALAQMNYSERAKSMEPRDQRIERASFRR